MQFIPASLQTPPPSKTKNQTQKIKKNKSSLKNHAPQPKSSQLYKPSALNSLTPLPISKSSSNKTPTYKKSPIIIPYNSTKLQPTSNQTNLTNNPNPKTSKLRPPSNSFKQKPINNPETKPQNFPTKTNIPKPLTKKKKIIQNPNNNLNSKNYLTSNRYSRLPKPKIH